MDENELVLPEGDEIRNLSEQDLTAYESGALAEIDTLFESDAVTRESVERGGYLEGEVTRARSELARRTEEAAALAAERDGIIGRLRGEVEAAPELEVVAAEAETLVAASTGPAPRAQGGVRAALRELGGLDGPKLSLNRELRGVKRSSTADIDLTRAQDFAKVSSAASREMAVLVASADIPGFTQGGSLRDMTHLAKAMHARARTLPVAHGNGQRVPVAQLQRTFKHTMNGTMSFEQLQAVLEAASDPAVMIASGGWCSLNEIAYDFYNIVCIDGILDLPTLGINRGGLTWPISPSFGDISALPGVVWTWTETQDIAAATGTGQSGVKPCVRVPCSGNRSARLDCDGMCVTVGNLMSDAYPEAIANHLRLVEAIHAHYMNSRLIGQLILPTNSTPVTLTGTDVGSSWGLLNAATFERRDLIEKYAMCDDSVFEAIYPRLAKDKIRNDLALRTGVSDYQCVTDSMIADWFDCRNIRTQWIADWQVRATGQPGAATPPTTWATNTQFMIFPAGTFARGQGMTLDLGVVRDSTLNATNDYTAAWMEECWLLAKIGHESRLVTVDDCVNGMTGQAGITGCQV